MSTATLKLIQMGSGPKTKVWVYKAEFGTDWTVEVEGNNDGMAYKATGGGKTFPEAVDECHRRWSRFADQMPEIMGALPPPPADDFQEADHMIRPTKSVFRQEPGPDDDIPF